MSLYRTICEYFDCVINYTEFVLAVEHAGLFVFSEGKSDKELAVKVSGLMSALALTKDQVIVCSIDNASSNVFSSYDSVDREGDLEYFHHVPMEYLEDFIRKYSAKKSVLTDDDIDSIEECFRDVKKNRVDSKVRTLLLDYGIELSVVDKLMQNFVITKASLYSAGVKYEDVDKVYEILVANDVLRAREEQDRQAATAVLVDEYVVPRCIAVLVGVVAGMVVFGFLSEWIGVIIQLICLRAAVLCGKHSNSGLVKCTFGVCVAVLIVGCLLLAPSVIDVGIRVYRGIGDGDALRFLNPLRWMEWFFDRIEYW